MTDRTEADILASMMGADSRRVDALVNDVGQVKGDVRALRGEIGHVSDGIGELRGSMVLLSRHSVLMETSAAETAQIRASQAALDIRLRSVELEMPGLRETRTSVMRAVWGLAAAVGLALLALVLKSKGLP